MKILGYEVSSSDVRRFESYICKTDDKCWLWTKGKSRGYGYFYLGNYIQLRAHRFSYELYVGVIPKHLQLDHLCRARSCVNPKHLELVTMRENIRRGFRASQKKCCKGHPYFASNTYYDKKGGRSCKECRRIRSMKIRQRNRTA